MTIIYTNPLMWTIKKKLNVRNSPLKINSSLSIQTILFQSFSKSLSRKTAWNQCVIYHSFSMSTRCVFFFYPLSIKTVRVFWLYHVELRERLGAPWAEHGLSITEIPDAQRMLVIWLSSSPCCRKTTNQIRN